MVDASALEPLASSRMKGCCLAGGATAVARHWMNKQDQSTLTPPFTSNHHKDPFPMNPSLYSFLAEPSCRALKVEYDPDHKLNNNYNICRLYKTLDPTIAVDNLVVVPTETRHGFTVCKVVEVDIQVNYNGNDEYRWVLGKVDKAAYDALIDQDRAVKTKIGKIEENKIKRELMEAMGLAGTDLAALSYSAVPTAEVAKPQRGVEHPAEDPGLPTA